MKLARGKKGDILQHCIYEIATGKWSPGNKLPSVREAENLWGVSRLTILSAYRELEKIGLVFSKDRSGYYVAESGEDSINHHGLSQLYQKVKKLVNAQSDSDLSYVFRYFNTMAVSESRANPAYAFLECTGHQAEDHANEIFQKLASKTTAANNVCHISLLAAFFADIIDFSIRFRGDRLPAISTPGFPEPDRNNAGLLLQQENTFSSRFVRSGALFFHLFLSHQYALENRGKFL